MFGTFFIETKVEQPGRRYSIFSGPLYQAGTPTSYFLKYHPDRR